MALFDDGYYIRGESDLGKFEAFFTATYLLKLVLARAQSLQEHKNSYWYSAGSIEGRIVILDTTVHNRCAPIERLSTTVSGNEKLQLQKMPSSNEDDSIKRPTLKIPSNSKHPAHLDLPNHNHKPMTTTLRLPPAFLILQLP